MNGMFSNIIGLGDLAKPGIFANSIPDQNLDFLAILETGRHDFTVSFLNHLSGGINFVWHSHPPRGRSGGILYGQLLSLLITEVTDVVMDEASLSSLYDLKATGQKSGPCLSKDYKIQCKWLKFPNLQMFPDEWHVFQ
jgi:hypothetical protein